VSFQSPVPDPFVRTTVHVGVWDALRALLRGRPVEVTVIVGGDAEVVNDVLELDSNTLAELVKSVPLSGVPAGSVLSWGMAETVMAETMATIEERYREVPGFVVFDADQARRELDERVGPRVRFRAPGLLELNGPAYQLLKDVIGAKAGMTHGVLLCFDPEKLRIGVVPAPVLCPPGKRQPLMTSDRRSEDWLAAVDAGLFVRLHRLDLRGLEQPVELVDGMLVLQLPTERVEVPVTASGPDAAPPGGEG
jgi:hypothetical protein